MEIIDKCGVRGLAPAVAAVENTNKVDQQTLRSIGLGSPKGIIFFDPERGDREARLGARIRQGAAREGQGLRQDWP